MTWDGLSNVRYSEMVSMFSKGVSLTHTVASEATGLGADP